MKTIKIKISISFLMLTMITACSNYLDVEQEGTLREKTLFNDFGGYADAMSAVYANMAKTNLYGKNLSYGFTDHLAQLYFAADVSNSIFNDAIKYQYQNQTVKPTIDNIWISAYQAISHLNNIIKFVETENANTNPSFNLIKGEAYGLRAFLHFDLLRLFAETTTANPQAMGIPYAEEFGIKVPKRYSLEETYNKILADLNKAEEALDKDSFTYTTRNPTVFVNSFNDFELDRDIHFNKYAVWATKARVYLWKNDMEQAGIYAKKVIESNEISLFEIRELFADRTYPFGKETIWGLYNDRLYQEVYRSFLMESQNQDILYVRQDLENIYSSRDYRFFLFFDIGIQGRRRFIRMLKPEINTGSDIIKDRITGVAMIRLPEMYYIAAEAYYSTDPNKAIAYLESVRAARGLEPLQEEQTNTKAKFIDEIFNERTKEQWGEGQLFLEHKRLNRDIMNADKSIIKADKSIFVLPLPDSELEFGN